ncbi:MAG: DUF4911 domain-containing protein [Desulfomonilia bacterium]|jgi:hypothetical protein|uniref:DUF4911 domain-containing protein n=1 Tax=anaerobic digester metagenome TaxID=1263854 RepID=A0A485LY23_9ZZZZ|nr:DUF4911 domain-containing protein [Pseudomonadota bacterium]HON38154.1 DUF4911 domain-containing protein [Deltaproteobacteria bacterium]HRS56403.1 DUF4911 domain-containing protein [Desulfomonilia bacterium]HPD21479.1 DUF4911 domain-containing protein [Deltaproteobacteria bacterium]HPX18068.1 DUF4911 domain-containing protein [Deltaproteobacteria bacterium]
MWETGQIEVRVNRDDISYLRFILEGYDGLGIVSTRDPIAAQVVITYPLSRKALLARLIHALHREGVIKEDIGC